jgi:tRNA(fMet)-specific endonuclease VapC
MNGKYLLDTSVVVNMLGGDDSITKQLDQTDSIYVPSIVMGELYFGAYKSGRVASNLKQIEAFIAENSILDCDIVTAHEYGLIKDQLKKKGYPIPDNDIWIATVARQYDLVLITRDNHFNRIDGLKLFDIGLK